MWIKRRLPSSFVLTFEFTFAAIATLTAAIGIYQGINHAAASDLNNLAQKAQQYYKTQANLYSPDSLWIPVILEMLTKSKQMGAYVKSMGVPAAEFMTVLSGVMMSAGGIMVIFDYEIFWGTPFFVIGRGTYLLRAAVSFRDSQILGV